jgi:hypothetical protein
MQSPVLPASGWSSAPAFAGHALRLPQCVPQWVWQALVNEPDHLRLFLTPEGQHEGTIE